MDVMNKRGGGEDNVGHGRLKAVEIFAGGGGMLLGTALAGFVHEMAVEWDHVACETLRDNVSANYPLIAGLNVVESDVRNVDWSCVTDEIDLLAGGPPCQPFSLGGLARAALDPRDMFPAMTSVVATLRPRAFVCENVRGLTRSSFSDYYHYILMRLQHPLVAARDGESWREHYKRLCREHTNGVHDDLHYEVIPTIVDAADYGVAQRRSRVFIVGFRSDVRANWSFPEPTHSKEALAFAKKSGAYRGRWASSCTSSTERPSLTSGGKRAWRTVRDALGGLPHPRRDGTSDWMQHVLKLGARRYPGHTGSLLDEPSKAIKAGVHGVPGGENMFIDDEGSLRYYTVREAARIQGFPDLYSFHGSWSEAMRQIGNAVPVELARKVTESIATCLIDDSVRKIPHRRLQFVGDVA